MSWARLEPELMFGWSPWPCEINTAGDLLFSNAWLHLICLKQSHVYYMSRVDYLCGCSGSMGHIDFLKFTVFIVVLANLYLLPGFSIFYLMIKGKGLKEKKQMPSWPQPSTLWLIIVFLRWSIVNVFINAFTDIQLYQQIYVDTWLIISLQCNGKHGTCCSCEWYVDI